MAENEKKEGFFKRAFREMKENAKAQHEVDKANFNAVKAESKAHFEEHRGTNTLKKAKEDAKASWDYARLSPSQKREIMLEEKKAEIDKANARIDDANKRIEEAKKVREEIKANKKK